MPWRSAWHAASWVSRLAKRSPVSSLTQWTTRAWRRRRSGRRIGPKSARASRFMAPLWPLLATAVGELSAGGSVDGVGVDEDPEHHDDHPDEQGEGSAGQPLDRPHHSEQENDGPHHDAGDPGHLVLGDRCRDQREQVCHLDLLFPRERMVRSGRARPVVCHGMVGRVAAGAWARPSRLLALAAAVLAASVLVSAPAVAARTPLARPARCHRIAPWTSRWCSPPRTRLASTPCWPACTTRPRLVSTGGFPPVPSTRSSDRPRPRWPRPRPGCAAPGWQ